MIDPVYFDFNLEMEQLAAFVRADADLLSDSLQVRIQKMLTSGMSPDAVKATLKADLLNGGPVFSGFRSTFHRAADPMIDDTAQAAIAEEFQENDRWEWITTSANPCNDCEPRHALVKDYQEWVDEGLPRSGFSVCGDYCKCVLVPASAAGTSIEAGPVKVKTIAEMRAEYAASNT